MVAKYECKETIKLYVEPEISFQHSYFLQFYPRRVVMLNKLSLSIVCLLILKSFSLSHWLRHWFHWDQLIEAIRLLILLVWCFGLSICWHFRSLLTIHCCLYFPAHCSSELGKLLCQLVEFPSYLAHK